MTSEQSGRQEAEANRSAFSLDWLLKILSLLIGASWLFFALGWIYLDAYYRSFRLDVQALDLPFYYPVLNSLFPLAKLSKLLVPLLRFLTVLGFVWIIEQRVIALLGNLLHWFAALVGRLQWFATLVGRLHRFATLVGSSFPTQQEEKRFHRFTRWAMIGLASSVVVYFSMQFLIVADKIGSDAGQNFHSCNMAQPWTKVGLKFKRDEEKLFGRELVTANAEGTLALLVQTKELLVVFPTSKNHANSGVFVIPRSNLLSVSLSDDIPCEKVEPTPRRGAETQN